MKIIREVSSVLMLLQTHVIVGKEKLYIDVLAVVCHPGILFGSLYYLLLG